MKISVIVPCYNEVHTIRQILEKVRRVVLDKEIIIVDGNSSDGTQELLKLEESFPDTRVLYQTQRCGRGLALKIGMQAATGDIILFQDADLELEPAEYPQLLKPILDGTTDVVFGSRFLKRENAHLSFWHEMGNHAITGLVNLLYGSKLTDAETGYQIFKKSALNGIQIHGDEFNFTVELTVKFLKKGLQITEVPISFFPRNIESGKKLRIKDGVESVWTLLKYRVVD
jgi:dolichol-phosphate mannosyltransferase